MPELIRVATWAVHLRRCLAVLAIASILPSCSAGSERDEATQSVTIVLSGEELLAFDGGRIIAQADAPHAAALGGVIVSKDHQYAAAIVNESGADSSYQLLSVGGVDRSGDRMLRVIELSTGHVRTQPCPKCASLVAGSGSMAYVTTDGLGVVPDELGLLEFDLATENKPVYRILDGLIRVQQLIAYSGEYLLSVGGYIGLSSFSHIEDLSFRVISVDGSSSEVRVNWPYATNYFDSLEVDSRAKDVAAIGLPPSDVGPRFVGAIEYETESMCSHTQYFTLEVDLGSDLPTSIVRDVRPPGELLSRSGTSQFRDLSIVAYAVSPVGIDVVSTPAESDCEEGAALEARRLHIPIETLDGTAPEFAIGDIAINDSSTGFLSVSGEGGGDSLCINLGQEMNSSGISGGLGAVDYALVYDSALDCTGVISRPIEW